MKKKQQIDLIVLHVYSSIQKPVKLLLSTREYLLFVKEFSFLSTFNKRFND